MRGMDDATILERLSALGHQLPPSSKAVAAYLPVKIAGNVAHVSGQITLIDGAPLYGGRLGEDVTPEQGYEAAERGALQALAALRAALGGFGRLRGISQVTVYLAATSDFVDHPQVANGASELLSAALGEAGQHARAAVGMSSLPLGVCVEVQVTAEVDPA
jgi:enamine deaminase RidA (YjgF/YER057c/UK114 family)